MTGISGVGPGQGVVTPEEQSAVFKPQPGPIKLPPGIGKGSPLPPPRTPAPSSTTLDKTV
jgi:hypothetical protein